MTRFSSLKPGDSIFLIYVPALTDRRPPGVGRGRGRGSREEGPKGRGVGRGLEDGGARGAGASRGRGGVGGRAAGNRGLCL